ncbi:MAG: cytochrome c-type biogenesis CcmF C-terminal domain-containing protein [Methanocellales archaeon]|nr:cytochrome c-type biogenesis CcmF C-terminal domain-containing protein [Methanocellales archaeon]
MNVDDYLNDRNVFLATIIVLSIIAIVLFIGLITPLFISATGGGEVRLEAGYFNVRTIIPTLSLLILLGLCLMLRYFKGEKLIAAIATATAATVICIIVNPFKDFYLNASLPVLVFGLAGGVHKIYRAINPKSIKASLRGVGPHLIHLGLILILLGAVVSTTSNVEGTRELQEGDSWNFHDYTISVIRLDHIQKRVSLERIVYFDIYKDGKLIDRGQTKMVYDMNWGQWQSIVYTKRGVTEDLYIALKGVSPPTVSLYARVVPMINFIWGGLIVMASGIALVTCTDYVMKPKIKDVKRRYEERLREELRRLREET